MSYLRVFIPSCNRTPAYIYGVSRYPVLEGKDFKDTGFTEKKWEDANEKEDEDRTEEENQIIGLRYPVDDIDYPIVGIYEISGDKDDYYPSFGACSNCSDAMYIYVFKVPDKVLLGNLQKSIIDRINVI